METAQFGMPDDREQIVDLKASHSGLCIFRPDQTDQDNLKLVRSNIKGLYRAALENGELTALPLYKGIN
jgi:hypothetical protein